MDDICAVARTDLRAVARLVHLLQLKGDGLRAFIPR